MRKVDTTYNDQLILYLFLISIQYQFDLLQFNFILFDIIKILIYYNYSHNV